MEIWRQNRGKKNEMEEKNKMDMREEGRGLHAGIPFIIIGLLAWMAVCLYYILSFLIF